MATIASTIKIFDGYSPVIRSMIRANQNVINSMAAVGSASEDMFHVGRIHEAQAAIARTESHFDDVERQIREAAEEQERLNKNVRDGEGDANNLLSVFKKMAVGVGAAFSARAIIALADQQTQTTARLNMMNDGLQTTAELQDTIFASAQRSRAAYQTTADMVSKLGMQAGAAFGSNTELIAFSEALNKSFAIAGTDAQGVESVMYNLTQAMASGVLRGQDLNAVFSNAPNIIARVADYMGVTVGEIRAMAADGELSANVIKSAMLTSLEAINAEFEQMPMTAGQVWIKVKNTAQKAFQPVLAKVSEIFNNPKFMQGVEAVAGAFAYLAAVALPIISGIGSGVIFVADQWDVLAPLVIAAATAMGIYLAVTKGVVAANALATLTSGFFKGAVDFLSLGFAVLSGNTAAASMSVHMFNTALLASPVTWILMIIIAIIGALYGVVAIINKVTGSTYSATGIILGCLAVLAAGIWNTIVGVLEAVIQFLWSSFVEPWIGIFEWVLNVMNGGFDSFGDGVKNLLGNIISWFLSLGKVVTKIIDAIFGTNWTAGLNGLQNEVLKWGKNENAVTITREAPSLASFGIERKKYGAAFDVGYTAGENFANNFKLSGLDPAAGMGDYIGNISDYTGYTAANTDGMLDIAEEDLKYMRDIAERDAINRYTTAEVTITQNNENHISSNMDLDGVIGYLNDGVEESVSIAAEGGHE